MSAYSFLAGVLTGAAVLAAGGWLWRLLRQRSTPAPLPQAGLWVVGGLATFALAAGVIYLTIGRSHGEAAPAAAAVAPHPVGGDAAGQQAQSMDEATAGLAARLAREGGSDKEWELLAKSYDFLGRPEDAKLARAHKAPPSAMAAASSAPPVPSLNQTLADIAAADAPGQDSQTQDLAQVRQELEQKLKSNPKDVDTLLDLAALAEREHRYAEAQGRFKAVIALNGMNADAWADYADVLAAVSGGSLAGEAAQAIEHSLALDPKNEKAQWLKASAALQAHRYSDALALWRQLRASLPADSQDIAAVDSNIAEATQLAGGGPPPPAAAAAVTVSGTVSIDPQLASQVKSGATLFIYARAVGQAGPPLAVMRTTAGHWPVSFKLDDSMAMMPGRSLSQFDKVVVEARVSVSGQATPSPGDLYVTSDVIHPAAAKALSLVINRKIG